MKFSSLIVASALGLSSSVALADDAADAIAAGAQKFLLCGACHGVNGDGQPAPGVQMAPSFVESSLVKANPEVATLILLKGIKKEDPAAFMGQMMMPLGATMPDEDVSALISYVRNRFGEMEPEEAYVSAETVAEYRAQHAETEMPTRAELIEMAAEDEDAAK